MRIIKEFPFATTFGIAGFFVGLSVLFSADFFLNYDSFAAMGNPAESLLNYLKASFSQVWGVITKGLLLGIVLGLIFGIGGLVADILAKKAGPSSYSKKTQQLIYGDPRESQV